MPDLQPVILRCVVGSQAFGTARPDSDFDYREAFYYPTSKMLRVGRPALKHAWQSESRTADDEGGHEIAQLLHLCSKGAPNAIEMLFAPFAEDFTDHVLGLQVQTIGKTVLNSKTLAAGAIGYAHNSFRKIPDKPGKWKFSMLRVLYQAELMLNGGLSGLHVPAGGWGAICRRALSDDLLAGEVYDIADEITERVRIAERNSDFPDESDFTEADEWLLQFRKDHWDE